MQRVFIPSHRSLALVLGFLVAFGSSARAQPEREPRTMVVIAHEDDDFTILHPDLAARINPTTPFATVYLTNGNAGLPCTEYTRGRELGTREVHARMVGVPNVWKEEERIVNGKLLRVHTLEGTQHALWFFGFPNSPEPETSLAWLWKTPGVRLSTMLVDGRSRVDSYTKDEVIETLKKLMAQFGAADVRMLDATSRHPEFYPFEHTDHVHSALFALSALQRYGKVRNFSMYRTYNTQFAEENLPEDVIAEREREFTEYSKHDAKICAFGKTTVCGERTRCYPLDLFLPFMRRRYTVDTVTHPSTLLFTRFGRCLKVRARDDGSYRVLMKRCGDDDPGQHFSLAASGEVRHLATGLCLAAEQPKLGSALTLAPCKSAFLQRFYVNEQGQLRGPNASCVRSGFRDPVLQQCGMRIRQTSWRVTPPPDRANSP